LIWCSRYHGQKKEFGYDKGKRREAKRKEEETSSSTSGQDRPIGAQQNLIDVINLLG